MDAEKARELLEALKQYDTPSVTNVVATYPQDKELCLGLYHPWDGKWYTDATLKCMYPELGRTVGYAVTVTYGMPDPAFDRLSLLDVYKTIEASPKPVVVCLKQNLPEPYKSKNGLCGGNMMTAFKSLGCVAVISDGPSRDLDEVRPMGMQYMLPGVCAGHGPFSIQAVNEPVEICGMQVSAGDIIHMDENGAVKFPREYLEEVVIRAKRVVAKEAKMQDALRRTGGDLEKIKMVFNGIYEFDDEKKDTGR